MARVARVMAGRYTETNLPCPVDVLPVIAGLATWLVGWPVFSGELWDGDLFNPCGCHYITFAVLLAPNCLCCGWCCHYYFSRPSRPLYLRGRLPPSAACALTLV